MPRTEANKQKLMPPTVNKLRPTNQAYLVWDTYQRGLALQIQPTGYRSYKLIYRFHGRSRWYHIGAADAIGLADARKLAAELMLEVIRGKDPAAEKRAVHGAGTFAEVGLSKARGGGVEILEAVAPGSMPTACVPPLRTK